MTDPKDKTLCALVEDNYIESHREDCGRSAVDPKNLCNPDPL